MGPSRKELLSSAQAFCDAFKQKQDAVSLITHFSTTHSPTLIEYGNPRLVPFLGKPFTGLVAIQGYFEEISSLLTLGEIGFYGFMVDTEACKVAVKGEATFTWKSTGESWEETIVYMLDFDDTAKITECQIWADSGSAYLARTGQLQAVNSVRAVVSLCCPPVYVANNPKEGTKTYSIDWCRNFQAQERVSSQQSINVLSCTADPLVPFVKLIPELIFSAPILPVALNLMFAHVASASFLKRVRDGA